MISDKRVKFVEQMGALLRDAKPNLVKCELMLGADVPLTEAQKSFGLSYPSEGEYVVVTCENDYIYVVSVGCDSPAAIVYDVFKQMMNH